MVVPWAAPRATAPVHATVAVPGSKSATNRALVLAALATGPSVLRGPLRSRDTTLMTQALVALGAGVADVRDGWRVDPATLTGSAAVDCGLAGTVMRFVPPLAALADGVVTFDGDPRARERPMDRLLGALRALGARVDDGGSGRLPFRLVGTGALGGGEVTLDASTSSQFVSGLLLSGARYDKGVAIHHEGDRLPSRPHISMTVAMLRAAGVAVDDTEPDVWRVEPGPIAPQDQRIEPDLSNAAPFLAAALVTGGSVTVSGWPAQTTQAGDALRELFAAMGATVSRGPGGLTVAAGDRLDGLDADLGDVGELTPVLAVVCALADGPSRLRGIGHLRGHETDRLAALATELNRLGGAVTETADGLTITPRRLTGGVFGAYEDHRMAQAGAVLGLVVDGMAVDDIATTAKTMPDFPRPVDRDAHRGSGLSKRRELDEDDVRVRPGRRSRPRTRTRPLHTGAQEGFVVGVDRGRYAVRVGDRAVTAMRARELGRKSVVVGDRVAMVGDTTGGPDALARIVRVEERTSTLRRTADDDDPYERVVVANADQLVIVTALADPPPRTGFVDRCLVAAFDAGIEPVLCLTKADLTGPEEFLGYFDGLDLRWVATRRDEAPTGLAALLTDQVSVLVGHSGVGKSTLVNALVPDADRATGVVSAIGKGRHTSSSAVALALPGGGWVIDTPGVRSFGLAHVSPRSLLNGFADLADGTEDCPPGCGHLSAADGCALDEWMATGHASPARLASYRRLLASR